MPQQPDLKHSVWLDFKFLSMVLLSMVQLRSRLPKGALISLLSISSLLSLTACSLPTLSRQPTPSPLSSPPTEMPSPEVTPSSGQMSTQALLEESWTAYRQQFIQADGRVIDYEASDRSTSEGQAYAMLRAVLADDPEAFDLTLAWAENNLQRIENNEPVDHLWVWKWGQDEFGRWGVLDPNFASDADIDAVTALILASRQWNRPDYLELALIKLEDLWTYSTVVTRSQRYLLPGPAQAFRKERSIYLNPSYLSPAAFRLFAQVDPERDWLSLVDSSYDVLEQSASLSVDQLPSDWIVLDTASGQFQPVPASSNLKSIYSFDAFRVWWRVAWDAAWFGEPRAYDYLRQHLDPLAALWREQGQIPAAIDLQGQPTVDYESTAQYAMAYAAFRLTNPPLAEQILQQKLQSQYQKGFWDDRSAYYTQNLVWLGLFPPTTVSARLLQPN